MHQRCIEAVQNHLSQLQGKKVELTPAQIKRYGDEFQERFQDMRTRRPEEWAKMTPAERINAAAKDLVNAKGRESRRKQLQAISEEAALVSSTKDVLTNAQNYKGAGRHAQGFHDFVEGVKNKVMAAEESGSAKFALLLNEALKYEKSVGRGKGDSNLWLMFGSRESDSLYGEMVKAINGESFDNPTAGKMAEVWSGEKEDGRQFMNRNGGNIGKLEHFMEAMHNPEIMKKMGIDAWVNFYMKFGNWKLMRHPSGEDWGFTTAATNGEKVSGNYSTMAEVEKRNFLKEAWVTLTTDGENKNILEEIGNSGVFKAKDDGTSHGSSQGYNITKSPGHRTLFLRDAAAMIEYNRLFSDQSLGTVFHNSLALTGRNRALISQLGPNPVRTITSLLETVKVQDLNEAKAKGFKGKYALGDDGWVKGAYRGTGIDAMGLLDRSPMDAVNTLFSPTYKSNKLDKIMAGYTSYKAATSLGFTAARAVWQDSWTVLNHAWHNGGLEGVMQASRIFNDIRKMTHDPEQLHDLNIFGVAMGTALRDVREAGVRMRVQDKLMGANVLSRGAQATMKYTGLNRWTDIVRNGGQMIHSMSLAKNLSRSWDELAPGYVSMYSRAGINRENWGILQQLRTEDYANKVKAVDVTSLRSIADFQALPENAQNNIENALNGFIRSGGDITTSEYNFQASMMTGALGQSGTAKSLLLFKNAGMVGLVNTARRMEHMSGGGRFVHTLAQIVGSYIFGYMALATTRLMTGREVPNPLDPMNAVESVFIGGGLTIFADSLRTIATPDNTSSSGSVPILSDISNMIGIGTSLATGDTEKAGYKAVRMARQQIPFLNFWYTKMLADRIGLDHAAEAFNPGYTNRLEKQANKGGSQYWWHPGELTPNGEELFRVGERQQN